MQTTQINHSRAKFTIAVAFVGLLLALLASWLPILWAHHTPFGNQVSDPKLHWPAKAPVDWPPTPDVQNYKSNGFGVSATTASHNLDRLGETKRQDPTVVVHWMTTREYGLPFRSIMRTQLSVQAGRTITTLKTSTWQQGVKLPARLQNGFASREYLPIQPVWLGFFGNWLLYWFLVWAVSKLFIKLRSRRRIRRGKCVRCAYAIANLPICPECGTPTHVP